MCYHWLRQDKIRLLTKLKWVPTGHQCINNYNTMIEYLQYILMLILFVRLCVSVWGWGLWAGGELSELSCRLRHLPYVPRYKGGHRASSRSLQQWLHPNYGGQSLQHTRQPKMGLTHTHTNTGDVSCTDVYLNFLPVVAPVPETEDVLGWKLDHQLQGHNIW